MSTNPIEPVHVNCVKVARSVSPVLGTDNKKSTSMWPVAGVVMNGDDHRELFGFPIGAEPTKLESLASCGVPGPVMFIGPTFGSPDAIVVEPFSSSTG